MKGKACENLVSRARDGSALTLPTRHIPERFAGGQP